MRYFLAGFAVACCAGVMAGDAAAPLKARPNVIIILSDDLGWSDLGCYGGEIKTPNIDALAAQGVRFRGFYNSARCCPTRASLVTGLHPHQAGIGSFATAKPDRRRGPAYTGHLLPSCVTLAELLGDAGYSTWMVGKWHMGIPGPIERGFQNYYGFSNFLAHSENQWDTDLYARLPEGARPRIELPAQGRFFVTDVFTDYALAFIREARRRPDKPYFLYLAYSSPHFPIQAPVEDIDRNMDTYRRGWDVLRTERFERMKTLGLLPRDTPLPPRSLVPVDRDDIANGYPGKPNPAWDSLPADRREDLARRMAAYASMVEHVDRGVGRVVAELTSNGTLDHTLIFFLSDNGACYEWGPFGFDGPSRQGLTTLHTGDALRTVGQNGTHHSVGSAWACLSNTPLNLYKHFCHEGGIITPLVVHWPEGFAGRHAWVDDPGHVMDIVPTVLDASSVPYPKRRDGHEITPLEGVSLLPALRGDKLPARSMGFEHQEARALRRGDWKVVWSKRMPREPSWELYNMADDRPEQHNLAGDKPALTRELADQWMAWARHVKVYPFFGEDASAEAPPQTVFPQQPTPRIAGRPVTIVADVEPDAGPAGVIVAQGGRENGYALHVMDAAIAFDVRLDGQVTRLTVPRPAGDRRLRLTAALGGTTLELNVNGTIAEAPSPGVIAVQPKDDMNIGYDALSAAGDYEPPNPFHGKIHAVKVTTE